MSVPGGLRPGQLAKLLEASLTVGANLDLAATLRRVVEVAVDLVDARYGALGVLDETGTGLAEFVTVGVDDDQRRRIGPPPRGLGLLGTLITDPRPLRLTDLGRHPARVGFPEGHPPMSSFLGVPLTVGGEVFGNLYLTGKAGGAAFSDEDERLVVGLASAAALAIDHGRLYARIQRREAALTAMGEIASALLAGAPPAESLRLVATHARRLARGELATVAVPQAASHLLAIEIAEGPLADDLDTAPFATAGSISGEVLRTGDTIVLADASLDPRTSQPQVRAGRVGPAVWVPLVREGAPFGVLSVARGVGVAPFDRADVELVGSFASQASVALEYDRGRQRLERIAVLEEGDRIARDLHDSVIQRIFATGMSLQATIARSSEGPVRDRISAAVDELDATIRNIRTTIFGLEAAHAGAPRAARDQVLEIIAESTRVLGFAPEVTFAGPLDASLDEPLLHDLTSSLREALSNVARHAEAHRVAVSLRVDDAAVELTVADDGIGISGEPSGSGGRGLANMRSRARDRAGTLEVGAAPGGGSVVTWRAPLGG